MVAKFTSQPTNKQVVNKINDVIDAIPTNLATVATSGSYNDLSNKPTIPTVNNATLTIQKNGTNVKTFTANASSNVTCNITVPTKTSDITNDSGYITGITSGDVTTALGYTPYNSTNPSGYISSIPSSYLQNTATGTNSLTISGTATTATGAVNIGLSSQTAGGYGSAFGYASKAKGSRSVALGWSSNATGADSIQLGYGTNSTGKTLSVGFYNLSNYTLLDGTTGLIPDARISNNIVKTVNNTAPDANGNVNVTASGGANTDLSNLSATGKTVIDGQWVNNSVEIYNGSISNSSSLTKTVTLPNDDKVYEVLISVEAETGTSSGNFTAVLLKSNVLTDYTSVCAARTRSNSSVVGRGSVIIPMKYGSNNLTIYRSTNYSGTALIKVIAYRRCGTNT